MNYDVIIVGGGINGAGIARDAAMRGLRVLLLERDDFASGASGKNGRMIHGGLRYLEQFEFGLVREALVERSTLLRIAPHLVTRRDLVIPIRSGIGRPGWMVRLGLFALDVLAPRGATRHQYLNKAETLRRIPSLKSEGLRGAAVMFDACAEHAERLTLENIIDAERHGAVVLNHSPVTKLKIDHGRVAGVTYRNGEGEGEGEEYDAFAPIVINATGAWADEFLAASAGRNAALLGPAKGSFIVVEAFEGAPDGSVFFEASLDRRPIIITPWNGLYLVGTTDERIAGPIDEAGASSQEVDYLLSELALVFPTFAAEPESVRYTYTGVRPLPRAEGKSTKVPRKHVIKDHAPEISGLVSILGGKLSTFRSLSEETVDLIFEKLGKPMVACKTAEKCLPGSEPLSGSDALHEPGLDTRTHARLRALYGARAAQVLSLVAQDRDLAEVIDAETGAIAAEILFAVRHEWASTFEDILVRRTMIGRNSTLGVHVVDQVAQLLADKQGWSLDRIRKNRANYKHYVEFSNNFQQSPASSAQSAIAKGTV